jgi:hypothetical protein
MSRFTSHSAAACLPRTNQGLTLHWKAPMATPSMPNSSSTVSLVRGVSPFRISALGERAAS